MNRVKIAFLLFFLASGLGDVIAQSTSLIDSLVLCLDRVKNDTQKVDLLNGIGENYLLENAEQANKYLKQALYSAQEIQYHLGIADAYQGMAMQFFYANDYDRAINFFIQSREVYLVIDNQLGVSKSYRRIGLTKAYQSNYNEAIENYLISLKIETTLENKKNIADCLNDLGVLYNYQGDHVKSMEFQKKSLKVCRELKDKKAISSRLLNLGASYDDQSEYAEAINCYLEALELKVALKDSAGISRCYNNLGEVYKDKADYAAAIENYEKSLNIDKKLSDETGIAICLLNIGSIHFKLKNLEKTESYLNEALQIADSLNDKRLLANIFNDLGELNIEYNKLNDAITNFKKAYQNSIEVGDKSEIAQSVYFLGIVFYEQEKLADAYMQFERALKFHKELGEISKMASDYYYLGLVSEQQKKYKIALKNNLLAYKKAKDIGAKAIARDAAENLARLYSLEKRYQKAYKFAVIFKTMNDSVFTLESQKQIAVVENRFELDAKQKEIEIQKVKFEKQSAVLKQKQTQLLALLIGLAGFVIIVIMVVINYIKVRKAKNVIVRQKTQIEETNEELNQTNEELKVSLEANNLQKELIEKSNKKITDSIHYAKYIQKAILPKKDKMNQLFSNHFILYKPKDIVSGDFYWTTQIEGRIIIAAADCTGHGVPGAFMSMLGISFLNDIVNKEYITHPGVILRRLRKEVINALQQEGVFGEQRDGMDISLCSIDLEHMELQFAGAHSPLYVIRSNNEEAIECNKVKSLNGKALYEIKGDKMPIALYEKMDRFKTIDIKLCNGDALYLFTDGYIDQFGGVDGKRLKTKPFKELLLENSDKTMVQQKYILEKFYTSWKRDYEQIDDVMILGIQI